jgi:Mg-chelatase subunit ChlD
VKNLFGRFWAELTQPLSSAIQQRVRNLLFFFEIKINFYFSQINFKKRKRKNTDLFLHRTYYIMIAKNFILCCVLLIPLVYGFEVYGFDVYDFFFSSKKIQEKQVANNQDGPVPGEVIAFPSVPTVSTDPPSSIVHPVLQPMLQKNKYLMEIDADDHFKALIPVPRFSAEGELLQLISLLKRDDRAGVEDAVERLRIALEKEGFFHKRFHKSQQVQKNFHLIQLDPIEAFAARSSPFIRLLTDIRPLDNTLLLKLLKTSYEVEKIVTNETVIFLVGKSGSGKSLGLHYFLNSSFKEEMVNGVLHIVEHEIVDDNLKHANIKIGVTTGRSETIEVRAIKIAVPNTIPVRYVYLCDSPGFFDSRDPVIDIINGISIVRVLRKSKAVYPVLVLNSGVKDTQWKGLKEVLEILTKMVPYLKQKKLVAAFSYLFTKGFDSNQEINAEISSVQENLNSAEEADESLNEFFNDMRGKLGSGSKAYILKPLDRDRTPPAVLLNGVTTGLPVSDCETNFDTFLSAKAKTHVGWQLKDVNDRVIEHLIESKGVDLTKEDLILISYRLDVTKKVIELTELQEYSIPYSDTLFNIDSKFKAIFRKELANFQHMIFNGVDLLDDEERQAKVLSGYQQIVKVLTLAKHFMETIGDNHFPKFLYSADNIHTEIQKTYSSRINVLFRAEGTVESRIVPMNMFPELNYMQILAFVQRIDFGSKIFPDFLSEKKMEIKNKLIYRSKERAGDFQEKVALNDFDLPRFTTSLSDMRLIDSHFSPVLFSENSAFSVQYHKSKGIFLKFFVDLVTEVEDLLEKKGRDRLLHVFKVISESVSNTELMDHFWNEKDLVNDLAELNANMLETVKKYLESLARVTKEDIISCSPQIDDLQGRSNEIKSFQSITELKEINGTITSLMHGFHNKLSSFAREIVRNTTDDFNLLQYHNATIESNNNLAQILKCLDKFKWIATNDYHEMKKIKESILLVFTKMKHDLATSDLKVNSPEKVIRKIARYYDQILVSSPLDSTPPLIHNLNESIVDIRNRIIQQRDLVLNETNFFLTKKSKRLHEESLNDTKLISADQRETFSFYLKLNIDYKLTDRGEGSTLETLNAFVANYSMAMEKQINDAFDSLLSFNNSNEIRLYDHLSDGLIRRMHEIVSFSSEPNFKRIYTDWFKDVTSKYPRSLLTLSHKVDGLIANENLAELNRLFNITTRIKPLDNFVDFVQGTTGERLGKDIGNAISSLSRELVGEVTRVMKTQNCQRARDILIELQNNSQVGNMRRCLDRISEELNEMKTNINTIQIINRDVEPGQIHSLAKSYVSLYECTQSLVNFSESLQLQNYDSTFFTGVWQNLENEITSYARIADLLLSSSFYRITTIQKTLENLKRIFQLYQFYGLDKGPGKLTPFELVNNTVELNRKNLEQRLSELEKSYLVDDLLTLSVAKMEDRFDAVKEYEIFRNTWETMKINLKTNVQNRVKDTRVDGGFCFKEKQNLDEIESVALSWPDDLRVYTTDLVRKTKQAVSQSKKAKETSISQYLREKDYTKVVEILNSMLNSCGTEIYELHCFEIERDYINTNSILFNERLVGLFSNSWTKSFSIQPIIEPLNVLHGFYSANYSRISGDYKQMFDGLIEDLVNLVNGKIIIALEASNSNNKIDFFPVAALIYDFVKQFKLNFPTIYAKDCAPNIKNSLESLENQLITTFRHYQTEFTDALKTRKPLVIMSILSEAFQNKEFEIFQQYIDPKKMVSPILTFDRAQELFHKSFDEWISEFATALNMIFKEGNNHEKRVEFYKQLVSSVKLAHELEKLALTASFANHKPMASGSVEFSVVTDINSFENKLLLPLQNQFKAVYTTIVTILKMNNNGNNDQGIGSEEDDEPDVLELHLSVDVINQFSEYYDHYLTLSQINNNFHLPCFEGHLKVLGAIDSFVERKFQSNSLKIENKLKLLNGKNNNENSNGSDDDEIMEEITNLLIELNNYLDLHKNFETKLSAKLHTILGKFSSPQISMLGQTLRDSALPNAFYLLQREATTFEESWNQLRNKETSNVKFDDAIQLYKYVIAEGTFQAPFPVDQEYELMLHHEYHKVFLAEYELIVKGFLKKGNKEAELVNEIMKLRQAATVVDSIEWGKDKRDIVRKLLPKLFALKTFYSANFSWKPHPVQLLSLFVLFGIGDPHSTGIFARRHPLHNHLLEIGTGEGKSVTLSIAALVFAHLGYDVNIACYSKHLSGRDEKAFRPLFQRLQIPEKQIVYGTFQQLAEDFINANGDIRSTIRHEILFGNTDNLKTDPATQNPSNRPRILLIDEVDVFLSPSFYQETYNVNVQLATSEITELMHFIWAQSEVSTAALDITTIATSPEYNHFLNKFSPKWSFLLKLAVLEMIDAVNIVKEKKETPAFFNEQTNRIGYQQDDDYSYNRIVGYETIFLYFREYKERNLNLDAVRALCSVNIDGGEFLYNQLPTLFIGIYGVTGTLHALTAEQKDTLKKLLKIDRESYIPSAYGSRQTRFQFAGNNPADLKLIDEEPFYFTSVVQEIEDRIKSGKRAVILFFASERQLELFYAFSETKLKGSGLRLQKMLKKDDADERENRIRLAVMMGTVTFAIRDYGRGTDFISKNSQLNENGGIHVIQTFFTEEISEEIQIQGRTARDSNKGSYSMVLLSREVVELFSEELLTLEEIKNFRSSGLLYDKINQVRIQKCHRLLSVMQTQANSLFFHQHSMKLRNSLSNSESIYDYIRFSYRRNSPIIPKRIIFALDYSGSMLTDNKITSARENCLMVFNHFINDFDHFGMILFNHEVKHDYIALQLKEGNEKNILPKIQELTAPRSRTKFRDAIMKGYQIFEANPSNNAHDWIFVLTDGDDSEQDGGSVSTLAELKKKVSSSLEIGIAIIGIGSDVKAEVLKEIVHENPQKGFYEHANTDKASITQAIVKTTRNIRQRARFNQ